MKIVSLLVLVLFLGATLVNEAHAQKSGGGGCINSFQGCVTKSAKRGWSQSQASSWCSKQPLCKR